jgi:UDP-N-acetylmuramoylalanine--D-glutamate ligase
LLPPHPDLSGKRILVMGLGLHGGGLGVTRWLVGQGARVTVTDLKSEDELATAVAALSGLDLRLALGGHRESDFREAELVIRNPGVPAESPYLRVARDAGVPVEMEMGLFFRLCPAPIIAITGTKGKSTTTSLVGAILRQSRPDAVVAGNIAGGSPQWHGALPALELLPHIQPDTPVVLELSSWQLEGLPSDSCPHIAAVTNVSPDHLNRYDSMSSYAGSKKTVFVHQRPTDIVVLNYDNPYTCAFATEAPSRVAWFSRRGPVQGAFVEGRAIRWRWDGRDLTVASTDDIRIPGAHNVENVLAATAVALAWGARPDDVGAAIREFHGVPHRLEFVAETGGVRYYNDTTATTPDAAVAALKALSVDRPVVLIAGGSDKGLAYEEMAAEIMGRTRALVLLAGRGTERLSKAILATGGGAPDVYASLTTAFAAATEAARPGDAVLLSPGCASFGMFANEFERGDGFRALVRELAEQ